jgi:hypothetical protein
MNRCKTIVAALLAMISFSASSPGQTASALALTSDTVVDPSALTVTGEYGQAINGLPFQMEALWSHAGYQYIGYYSGSRHVCLARRKLPDGPIQTIQFSDYHVATNDAHNIISIGICDADGTIHLNFDEHATLMHYRVSKPGLATHPDQMPWTEDQFGPIRDYLEPGKPQKRFTYPNFVATSGGGLQLFFRNGTSGNGDEWMATYDPTTANWKNVHEFISGAGAFTDEGKSSSSRNAYPNPATYAPDGTLDFTWTWREGGMGNNHDIAHALSKDGGVTWLNESGQTVAKMGGQLISIRSKVPGVAIDRHLCVMNTQGQAVDSKGDLHVLMWHSDAEGMKAARPGTFDTDWGPRLTRRYYHYWRSAADGTWHTAILPDVAGTRPRLAIDAHDNAWAMYTTDSGAVDAAASGLYFPNGKLVIDRATAATGWTDWQRVYVNDGPFLGEVLDDPYRLKSDGVLSVMMQSSPSHPGEATPLHVFDFRVDQ